MLFRCFIALVIIAFACPAIAGQNQLFIQQIGERQLGTILQHGSGNQATLIQGVDDPAQLGLALGEIGKAEEAASLLPHIQPIISSGNTSALVQLGAANRSVAVQHGASNSLATLQTGSGNTAFHAQVGNGNLSTLVEIGNNNDATLKLIGDDNSYLMSVVGDNLRGISVSVQGTGIRAARSGGLTISNR